LPDSVACHWTGSNGSWNLTFSTVMKTTRCFCDSGAVYKCDHLVSSVASLDIRSR